MSDQSPNIRLHEASFRMTGIQHPLLHRNSSQFHEKRLQSSCFRSIAKANMVIIGKQLIERHPFISESFSYES